MGWDSFKYMNKFVGEKVKVLSKGVEIPYFECDCNDDISWWFNEEDLQEIEEQEVDVE